MNSSHCVYPIDRASTSRLATIRGIGQEEAQHELTVNCNRPYDQPSSPVMIGTTIFHLGRALLAQKRYPEAIVAFEQARVDQLFNSSEKRLARILLLLAQFGKESKPETVVPKISQELLADIIGTTRSRANFFMNRFRKTRIHRI